MTDDFRRCEFCGCNTNARARACCELGRACDLERLEPELLACWTETALRWLPVGSGRYGGELLDDPLGVVAGYAGQVLVLIMEVERLRELRNVVGKLSQALNVEKRLVEALSEEKGEGMMNLTIEQRNRIERLTLDEHKASERANRLARMLGEALEVLEEPGRYLDGGLAKLRMILTSEEEPKENVYGTALEAWRADAETHLRAPDLGTRRLARRLVAVIDELEEEERKAKGAAEAWLEGRLLGEAERARSPVAGVARIELVPVEDLPSHEAGKSGGSWMLVSQGKSAFERTAFGPGGSRLEVFYEPFMGRKELRLSDMVMLRVEGGEGLPTGVVVASVRVKTGTSIEVGFANMTPSIQKVEGRVELLVDVFESMESSETAVGVAIIEEVPSEELPSHVVGKSGGE